MIKVEKKFEVLSKIAKVTEMIVETENKKWEDVLIELYNSKVYADLEKEETKLWHEGATYIYESFKEEKHILINGLYLIV